MYTLCRCLYLTLRVSDEEELLFVESPQHRAHLLHREEVDMRWHIARLEAENGSVICNRLRERRHRLSRALLAHLQSQRLVAERDSALISEILSEREEAANARRRAASQIREAILGVLTNEA